MLFLPQKRGDARPFLIACSLAAAAATPLSAASLTGFFDTYSATVEAGINDTPLGPTPPSTRLSRIATPDYADGTDAPVERPNPRALSTALSAPENVTPEARPLSNLAVEMLQLLSSHEIARSPTGSEVFNIDLPPGEGLGGDTIMRQSRSTFERDGSGARQQLNDVTHIFDASTVYGSDAVTQALLRSDDSATTGKMKVGPGDMLPIIGGRPKAGDVRADENPGLQAVHTLFLREHNRLADEIAAGCVREGRTCSGDQIYAGARRLVAATQEKIFYEELLPLFLGTSDFESLVPDKSLVTLELGAINSYTAAAGRTGHTQVPQTLRLQLPGEAPRDVDLSDCFFNPACLGGASLDEQLYGLTQQAAEPVDTVVTEALRNTQITGPGATFLIDLFATNINRGRDHGIPDYLSLRAALGFADAPVDTLLPSFVLDAYPDWASTGIDAIVGIFAEAPVGPGYLGETGAALWALQFLTLQNEHSFLTGDWGIGDYLSGVSMAGLIADNTGIERSALGNVWLAPAQVPLPATMVLMAAALGLLYGKRRA